MLSSQNSNNILLPCGHESEFPKDDCLPCSKFGSDPAFKQVCLKIHKDRQTKNLAPIIERVQSLVDAKDKFQASGLQLLEEALYNDRMTVCNGCTSNIDGMCTEPKKETGQACGCMVAVKAKIPTEDCPAGKWPRINLEMVKGGKGCGGCGKK